MRRSNAVVTAVRRELSAAGLVRPGVTLVAGLSGGADSVSLIDALLRVTKRTTVRVVAAHLDHRMRPTSPQDAAFCEALCLRLKVPLRRGIALQTGKRSSRSGGPEEIARLQRYAFLRRVAREEGAAAVALGHTLSDQAETVLMRLVRGAGAEGLSAMQPWDGELFRPLLSVERCDIDAYVQARKLAHVEDESNRDTRFVRNRIRHVLLPLLEKEFNPRIVETLGRTATLLREESRALREIALGILERARVPAASGFALDGAELRAAPRGVRRAAIREGLRRFGGLRRVSAIHIERIDALVEANRGGARLPIPGGRLAQISRNTLLFSSVRPDDEGHHDERAEDDTAS